MPTVNDKKIRQKISIFVVMATCGVSAWSADVSYFLASSQSLYANGNSALSIYSSSTPAVSLSNYGITNSNSGLSAYSSTSSFAGTSYGSSLYGSSIYNSSSYGSGYDSSSSSGYLGSLYGSSGSSSSSLYAGSSSSVLGASSSPYAGYSGYSGSTSSGSLGLYGSTGVAGYNTQTAPPPVDYSSMVMTQQLQPLTSPQPVAQSVSPQIQAPITIDVGTPEPASLLLVAGGLVLAAGLRKRFAS